MSTEADLLNIALRSLEQPRTTGSSDTSTWVRRINDQRPESIRRILSEYSWNCATVREQLVVVAGTPIGASYKYNRPVKCLRLNWINNSGRSPDIGEQDPWWVEEAGFVLCDFSPAFAGYISTDYQTAYGSWPPMLMKAIGEDMAYNCAGVSTKSDEKHVKLERKAMSALNRARSWDASQRGRRLLPHGSWVRSRWHYGPRSRYGYDIE